MGTDKKPTGFGNKLQGLSKILDNTEKAANSTDTIEKGVNQEIGNETKEENQGNTTTAGLNDETNSSGPVVRLTKKDLDDVVDKKTEAKLARSREASRKKKKNVPRLSVHAEAGLHKKMKVKLAEQDITFYDLIDTVFEMLLEDKELFKRVKLKVAEKEGKELE